MPIYEYRCAECGTEFQELRPMAQADAPIRCPHCGSQDTQRVLSLFAAHSRSSSGETVSVGGSSGCSACKATSCAGCSR
ncbi:MAG: zinc ribbon domain-containing protein [Anaerolineae bacterium]|nr:zinc ribbon domain-containing protein [Anaerolineae bacterium]